MSQQEYQQRLVQERQRLENERNQYQQQLAQQLNEQQRQQIQQQLNNFEQQLQQVKQQEINAEKLFIEQRKQEAENYKQQEILNKHSPNEIISLNRLQVFERIGKGGFAEVFRGSLDGKVVAVKKLKRRRNVVGTMETMIDMRNESEALKKCKHSSIVDFIGVCLDQEELWIVTEYVDGTDLHRLIHIQNVDLSEIEILEIATQICEAVAYMHQQHFIHRDIKSSNILLNKVGSLYYVKVADLGIARQIDWTKMSWAPLYQDIDYTAQQNLSSEAGTLLWMSPEVFFGQEYNEKCDVYSFGMVLYEMITGEYPYPTNISKEELAYALRDSNGSRLFQFEEGTKPHNKMNSVSTALISLVHSCVGDMNLRPELAEILSQLGVLKQNYYNQREYEMVLESSLIEDLQLKQIRQEQEDNEELEYVKQLSLIEERNAEMNRSLDQFIAIVGYNVDSNALRRILERFEGDIERSVRYYYEYGF
jgi:serine/threonine protein kinase